MKAIISDVPAVLSNGRTMVPLRAISEEHGQNIEWDSVSSTVAISVNDNQ